MAGRAGRGRTRDPAQGDAPAAVVWLDVLLGQVERGAGPRARQIGIEAQIEDAGGLAAVDAIAAASPRLVSLVFGPADFMARSGCARSPWAASPRATRSTRTTTR